MKFKKLDSKMSKMRMLKKGDIIDIIAPSSGCDKKSLLQAVSWIEQQGYIPRFSKDILKPRMYLAQSDDYRLKDFLRAIKAKDSSMVWCLRGGYGCIRLLPFLKKEKLKYKKIFMGLSDITLLHLWLNQHHNWVTVHGPMLDRSTRGPIKTKPAKELLDILSDTVSFIDFKKIKPLNKAAQKTQTSKKKVAVKSRIIGGNLRTFCSVLGTDFEPQVNGHFLFFEDIAERGYKVDRMLQQLRMSGMFKKCKGVFFADFTYSDESNGKNYVWPTIKEFFAEDSFPVFSGVESDHSENQRPLFLNSKAELIFDKKYTLRVYNKQE